MYQTIKHALIWALSFGCAVLVVLFAIFRFGPSLEATFMPVFKNVAATPVSVDFDKEIVHIAASGNKVRQCDWRGISARVKKDGVWIPGSIYFEDPNASAAPSTRITPSRPVGQQDLGQIWVFPAGDVIEVHLHHRCHPFWPTETIMYKLRLSQYPAQVQ